MSSSDDDLPDVVGGRNLVDTSKASRLKIDVNYEIRQSQLRKETHQKIAIEQKKFEAISPVQVYHPPVKTPKITPFPENRPLFDLDRSQKCFNSGSLSLKESCPLVLKSDNSIEYFQCLRIRLQGSPAESRRSLLIYLWFMQSVHPNPHIVFKCHDLLLESNDTWRLKWEEVMILFWNWGASLSDFLTEKDLCNINSPLPAEDFVTPYNVECALNILKEQLSQGNLEGDIEFKETVFILICLLSLDANYASSVYAIQQCLDAYETLLLLEKSAWVSKYCQNILKVEENHARVVYLVKSVLPKAVRKCLAYAYCQIMLSLPSMFVESPEPSDLINLLQKHFKVLLQWDSYEIYSFVTLIDCTVADTVTIDTEKESRLALMLWLRDFYQNLSLRPREDIDVDATVVSELLGRLQTEWEGSWPDISNDDKYFCDVYNDDL